MSDPFKNELASFRAERYQPTLNRFDPVQRLGQVEKVVGLTLEAVGPPTFVGETCLLKTLSDAEVLGEVVGFREGKVLLFPLGDMEGIGPGSKVVALGEKLKVPVGPGLLGESLMV